MTAEREDFAASLLAVLDGRIEERNGVVLVAEGRS